MITLIRLPLPCLDTPRHAKPRLAAPRPAKTYKDIKKNGEIK